MTPEDMKAQNERAARFVIELKAEGRIKETKPIYKAFLEERESCEETYFFACEVYRLLESLNGPDEK